MEIYPAEKNVASLMSNNKTTIVAKVISAEVTDAPKHIDIKPSGSKSSRDDIDMAVMRSVLVSTGFNLNGDVFTPEELFAAKESPIDKPINLEHNEKDIVGHMISSEAVAQDSNAFNDEANLPSTFDIEVEGILYKGIFPEVVANIVEGVKNGTAFVSMEALFTDFDFALEKDDEIVVIPRNEKTAFLTSHLKQFGGSGKFTDPDSGDDMPLGRVLKNITFIGKGIVSNPANPRSLIKEAASVHFASEIPPGIADKLHKEGGEQGAMSDNLEKELETVRSERDNLKVELENVTKNVAELNTKIEELTSAQSEAEVTKESEIKTLTDEAAQLKEQVGALTKEVTEFKAKEEEINAQTVAKERFDKLTEISKIDDGKVDDTLAKLRPDVMTDDQFELLLSMNKNLIARKEEDTTKDSGTDNDSQINADANDELNEAKANENDAVINPGQEDEAGQLMAATAKAVAGRLCKKGGEKVDGS